MQNSVVCTCSFLLDNLLYCAPVRLADGDLDAIYVGSSGVFAVVSGDLEPASVYSFLRDYLGTTRVDVYHAEKGRYNASGELIRAFLTTQELDTAIYHHATQGPVIWSEDVLNSIRKKIRVLDGINRGVYCDDENNWFIVRGKNFYPCSAHDADHIFRLSLYGGVLGLHRFAIGKWFTGSLYLLTGGLLGFGWLLDSLQILSGSFKDRKGCLLPKPSRLRPLSYLRGIICGLLLFCLNSGLLTLLTGTFNQILFDTNYHIDTDQAAWLLKLLHSFSEE